MRCDCPLCKPLGIWEILAMILTIPVGILGAELVIRIWGF